MTKHELELKKLIISSEKFKHTLDLIKHIFTLLAALGCVYLIFAGLTEIAKAQSDSLSALALVVEKLNLSSIIAYIVACGTTAGWMYERKGKKRLIKGAAAKRKEVEANDPYNGSSGLTDLGETP